ncbi:MAG: thioredoxin [Candidatus Korarchaeota archaeon]
MDENDIGSEIKKIREKKIKAFHSGDNETYDHPIHLNEENFDEFVSSGLVLVDFWAPWCGPCNALAPSIDRLAREMQNKIRVGKVNVDENESLAIRFGIMSIPTLFVFKDGELVYRYTGYCSYKELVNMVSQYL